MHLVAILEEAEVTKSETADKVNKGEDASSSTECYVKTILTRQ